MFEQIVGPKRVDKPYPEERRQFRVGFGIGTFVFGLAVLLQLAHDDVHSLFFTPTRIAVLVLMLLGLGFPAWGARALGSISWQTWKKH